jgi:DNA-binding SARP family transcriptional activator
MPALRLRLMDGFALESSRGSIQLPVGLQRLLAFLALRGPAHRYVVAGTLWPEVPDAHALASLRTGVWRMNRILPGVIQVRGAALLAQENMSVDSRDQEELTTRVMRDVDERGLGDGLDCIWLAELLPGWYDDWVVLERERLSQLRLHALEHLAMVMTRGHQLEAALQFALEAFHAEPLRETANAALMEVYLAEGNISSAVHHYELFRDLLRRELDLEPSPGLQRLLPEQALR